MTRQRIAAGTKEPAQQRTAPAQDAARRTQHPHLVTEFKWVTLLRGCLLRIAFTTLARLIRLLGGV